MKPEQLTHANLLHAKVQQLKGSLMSIRSRTKPQGPNATPQQLNKEGHSLTLSMGPTPLVLVIPEHLAQKFMEETDRYYDGELLSAEREFERI